MLQVAWLHAMLQSIHSVSANEPVNLVGHSAGGVVARAVMVLHPGDRINQLITIASPHLGTSAASAGAFAASSPIGVIARWFGKEGLSRSSQLLSELAPQRPDNFLGWLNRQAHPQAGYISLVRAEGDGIISPRSQDMRNVMGLYGRAMAIPVPGGHALQVRDGDIIAALLQSDASAAPTP